MTLTMDYETPDEVQAAQIVQNAVDESEEKQYQFRYIKSLIPLTTPPEQFKFITADFECEPWEGTTRRQVTWYDGEKVRESRISKTAEREFLKWLRESPDYKGQPVYIHNLNYDGLFLMEGATHFKMPWTPLYRNRLFALDVELSDAKENAGDEDFNHSVQFRDSFMLTFASLAKLTREFQVEHQKLPHGMDNSMVPACPNHGRNCPSASFFNPSYRHNDVVGLYEVLQKMFTILQGDVGLTLASTSMRTFRRHYLKRPVWRNQKLLDVQRRAYYGARTEVFRFNFDPDQPFYYYDVNSLYPSVMRDLEVPVGELVHGTANIDSQGFSYAQVEEDYFFPTLPIRGGKLFFTNGKKTGWFTNDELRYCRERGSKIKVFNSFVCDETEQIFSHFVDDLYSRRLKAKHEGNTSLAFVTKLLLNSCYGKFAQKQEASDFVFEDSSIPVGATPMNASESIWKVNRLSDSMHIIPVIGALITSAARLRMAHELEKVEPESVYMMDTDSFVLDKPALTHSEDLGKFKLEGKIHKYFVFAPKVYFYEDEDGHTNLKMKGVTAKSGDDDLSFKERLNNAIDFVSGKKVENRSGIESLLTAMKKSDGTRFAYSRKLTRSFAGGFDKRLVSKDGTTRAHVWERPAPPESFANPKYPAVLESVRKQFVKAYAT